MGRVINPESVGKERQQLTRATVLAVRELMKQSEVDSLSKDLAAFIAIALLDIFDTVDSSVVAWEKRGYWLKADRFRMDWAWTESLGQKMYLALSQDDWGAVAMNSVQIAQKLSNIKIPVRHRLGTPWVGAWKHLNENSNRFKKAL